jgi:hypothetical protein
MKKAFLHTGFFNTIFKINFSLLIKGFNDIKILKSGSKFIKFFKLKHRTSLYSSFLDESGDIIIYFAKLFM